MPDEQRSGATRDRIDNANGTLAVYVWRGDGTGGGEEKASTADPHNLALPKHLELQGLECGKMGQRVRQLNAERKFDEARRVAQERLTLAESTYGKEHLVTATCLNDVGTFAQVHFGARPSGDGRSMQLLLMGQPGR